MDRRCVRDDFIRRLSIVGSRVQVVATGITRNDDDDVSWVGSLHDVDAENHPIMASLRRPLEALEIDRTYGDGVDVIIEAARREAQAAALPRPRRG